MATGAFGTHGLRKRPGMTADGIHAWETASSYVVSFIFSPSALTMPLTRNLFWGAVDLQRFGIDAYFFPSSICCTQVRWTGHCCRRGRVLREHLRFGCCSGQVSCSMSVALYEDMRLTAQWKSRFRWMGPITPLGGSLMMIG